MSEDENGEAPHNIAEEIEFLLEQGLSVDEMFDCLKTAKSKPLVEASKNSATVVIKDILAVLSPVGERNCKSSSTTWQGYWSGKEDLITFESRT